MAAKLDTMPISVCFIISFKGYTVDKLKEVLESSKFYEYCTYNYREFAYIIHDKDMDDYNRPKTLHLHFCGKAIKGAKKRLITRVVELSKLLGVNTQAVTISKCDDLQGYIRYLIHLDDLDKYQYSIDEIISNYDKETLQAYMDSESVSLTSDRLLHIIRNSSSRTKIMRDIGLSMYQHYRATINDLISEGNLGSDLYYNK